MSDEEPPDALIGTLVAGKYRVLRKLGAGGMGAVYEAEQQPLGRKIALKVIKRSLTDEAVAVRRFINEARAVAQLNHNNIVTIHDFGAVDGEDPTKAGGGLYIAMELLDGHDLREEILLTQRLSWERSSRIVAEVARALAEAHTRGIVHRDLKPDNVMILQTQGDELRVKVVDFGVAKLLPEHGGTAGMTGTGMVVGTPGYISPEQINGVNDDARSDLYALGVMWYEMLLGVSPFDAETPVKLVLKHLTEPVPGLSGMIPGVEVPLAVEELVHRLLAKEPEDRPANAIVLVNAIERLLHGGDGLRPDQATEAVNADEVHSALPATANHVPSSTTRPRAAAPRKPGSAATFPRPAGMGTPEESPSPAALAASAATPETGQALPVAVLPEPPVPQMAAKPRGCFGTLLMGCGLLTLLTTGSGILLIILAALSEDDVQLVVADGGDLVLDSAPEPLAPEPNEAPTGRTKKAKKERRQRKGRGAGRATSTPPSSVTIQHPPQMKDAMVVDLYSAALAKSRRRVKKTMASLIKRRNVGMAAIRIEGYYGYNASLLDPDSRAYQKLDEAKLLIDEEFGEAAAGAVGAWLGAEDSDLEIPDIPEPEFEEEVDEEDDPPGLPAPAAMSARLALSGSLRHPHGWRSAACAVLIASACSTDEGAERGTTTEASPPRPAGDGTADDDSEAGLSAEEREATQKRLALPQRWEDVSTRLEFLCPGPLFELEEPTSVEILGHTFERQGSTWVRSEPLGGTLIIGLVGAPKDSSDATRSNLRRADKAFRKAKATLVLVNGDLAEDEELKDVMRMLGEVFSLPVAVHAGNIEWAGAFTNAFELAHRDHPHLINMNWARHLDFGGLHLISLPGYHDHRFTRSGACRYSEADLKGLRGMIAPLRARGDQVVLTAHGPPRSQGEHAIDFAHDAGNVGDPQLSALIREEDVRVGLFSHILEAGGRATSDLKRGTPLRLPVEQAAERLFVNAGASSSYPWLMHGGKNSEGMAMIIEVTSEGATAELLKLR